MMMLNNNCRQLNRQPDTNRGHTYKGKNLFKRIEQLRSSNKTEELISFLYSILASKEIDFDPNFKARIYEILGEVYMIQNELDRAIENHQFALILSPKRESYIYKKLGELYELQNEIDEAILNYEKAIKCNPRIGVSRKLEKLNNCPGRKQDNE